MSPSLDYYFRSHLIASRPISMKSGTNVQRNSIKKEEFKSQKDLLILSSSNNFNMSRNEINGQRSSNGNNGDINLGLFGID